MRHAPSNMPRSGFLAVAARKRRSFCPPLGQATSPPNPSGDGGPRQGQLASRLPALKHRHLLRPALASLRGPHVRAIAQHGRCACACASAPCCPRLCAVAPEAPPMSPLLRTSAREFCEQKHAIPLRKQIILSLWALLAQLQEPRLDLCVEARGWRTTDVLLLNGGVYAQAALHCPMPSHVDK